MKYTRVLLIVAAIVFCSQWSFAQISYGPSVGINYSMQSYSSDVDSLDTGENPGGKIGFHIGGFVGIPISESFSFTPALLFTTKGSKDDVNTTTTETILGTTITTKSDYTSTANLSYIEIPMNINWHHESGFSATAGVYVGILAALKYKSEGTITQSITGFPDQTTDISGESTDKDGTNTVDFGPRVGIGYSLDNGLGFHFRYELGLLDVDDSSDDFNVKNSNFMLGAHWSFGGE